MKNDSYPVLTSEEIKVTATLQSYIINIKQQQNNNNTHQKQQLDIVNSISHK